ncbi:hypothetical protein K445DRAFT_315310 [Daldinia sp. EC12]|nr:hypothetical protein K445DRAFT_315310 [Daldinia sp. EC12]
MQRLGPTLSTSSQQSDRRSNSHCPAVAQGKGCPMLDLARRNLSYAMAARLSKLLCHVVKSRGCIMGDWLRSICTSRTHATYINVAFLGRDSGLLATPRTEKGVRQKRDKERKGKDRDELRKNGKCSALYRGVDGSKRVYPIVKPCLSGKEVGRVWLR